MKTFTGEIMRKRTLTVTCRYEPDELADKHLSEAYEQLLKYSVKRNNEKEVEKDDNGSLVCKSFIRPTSAGWLCCIASYDGLKIKKMENISSLLFWYL